MIAIGSDHGGYELKCSVIEYLEKKGVEYKDFGCYDRSSCDYPDFAVKACSAIVEGICDKALLFCGTGIGISIAANKVPGIRAACCSDVFSAKFTRLHNDANVLCLGGRVVGTGLALELVETFLTTKFEGGRHSRRVEKIKEIEINSRSRQKN